MKYSYSPYDDTLKITRLLFAALFLLFVAALLYASGMLVYTGDQLVLTIETTSIVLW